MQYISFLNSYYILRHFCFIRFHYWFCCGRCRYCHFSNVMQQHFFWYFQWKEVLTFQLFECHFNGFWVWVTTFFIVRLIPVSNLKKKVSTMHAQQCLYIVKTYEKRFILFWNIVLYPKFPIYFDVSFDSEFPYHCQTNTWVRGIYFPGPSQSFHVENLKGTYY